MLRDGDSGNVLLTAKARGLLWWRDTHWTLRSPSGDRVLEVYAKRLWWRRKRHGKGAQGAVWCGAGLRAALCDVHVHEQRCMLAELSGLYAGALPPCLRR